VLVTGVLKAQDTPEAQDAQLTMTVVSNSPMADVELKESSEPGPQQLVSMDFQDADLKDVLKIFSQQTGINVIASEAVRGRTVTLYLEDVAVLDALDRILEAADLTYERPPGSQIYVVKPKPPEEAPKIVTQTRVYRLKFARVSTSRLARAAEALGSQTPFEAQQLTALGLTGATGGTTTGGTGITGGTSVGGTTGQAGQAAGQAKEIGIDKIVEKLVSEEGEVAVDERTNSLVVTDLPENFPRIESVLNILDIRTAQILIETELLETTLSKLKDLGVEWGTGSEGSLLTITPAQRATKFPFFQLEDKQTFLTRPSAPAFTTGGQIVAGVIDASQISAVLQALERDTDTKILARPKVLTLDNESAVIRLTSQQAVAVRTTVIAETGTTEKSPERMTTGIILVVTPQVNEGGFVTMLIEPSVTKTVPSEIDPSNIVDPKSRSARAMVRIRQGQTLVLGGLIDRSDKTVLQRVPILSGIPILGEAFKNREMSDSTSELIVFVTPRILAEPPGTQVASVGQAPFSIREQETTPARQDVMEEVLKRLERPPL